MRKLFIIFFSILVFAACNQPESVPGSLSESGGVTLHFDYKTLNVRNISDLYYMVFDANGALVPDLKNGDTLRPVGLTALQGGKVQLDTWLDKGVYTFVFVSKGAQNYAGDGLNRHVENDKDELYHAGISAQKPVSHELFYGKTTVDLSQTTQVAAQLERIVGLLNLDIKAEQSILDQITGLRVKYEAGEVYNTLFVNGKLACKDEQKTPDGYTLVCDLTETRKFYSLPTVGAEQNGVIEIDFLQPGNIKETRVIYFNNVPISQNRATHVGIALEWAGNGNLTAELQVTSSWGTDIDLGEVGEDIPAEPLPGEEIPTDPGLYYGRSLLVDDAEMLKAYDLLYERAIHYNTYPATTVTFCSEDDPVNGIFIGKFDLTPVYYRIMTDHPNLFHVTVMRAGQTGYPEGHGRVLLDAEIGFGLNRDAYDEQYRDARIAAYTKYLADMPAGLSEYERVKYLHDAFLPSVSYGGMNEVWGSNFYGAFVKGKVVCQGYALAMQYLLQMGGIRALYVTGKMDGVNHAWVIVRVDGKYYQMDPTSDDGVGQSTGFHYTYFLKSDATMSGHHILDAPGSYGTPLPECDEDYIMP